MAFENNTTAPKSGKQGRRDRYWSLMLVGEHGRIIPVRHIKGIAVLLVGTLISALIALGILGFFHTRQSSELKDLYGKLDETRQQLSQLRDEKDMLLAKLVIENKIPVKKKAAPPVVNTEKKEEKKTEDQPREAASAPPAQTPSPEPKAAPEKDKPPAPAPAPEPKVAWGAQIRDFKVSYQQDQSILRAVFKIFNTSKPKKFLSGRIVVIFKKADDIPMKWLTVPRVQLENETPDSKKGKVFGIHNYRTMDIKAYGLKPPIDYDTAVVFVFTADGDMILKKEFGFKIKVKLAPAPAPPPVAPAPNRAGEKKSVEEKKPAEEKKSVEEEKPAEEKQPEHQSEIQNQTLFPFNTPGNDSKLPSILRDNKPIDLAPEKNTETSPAPEKERTRTPPPGESSPTQPEGEKEQ